MRIVFLKKNLAVFLFFSISSLYTQTKEPGIEFNSIIKSSKSDTAKVNAIETLVTGLFDAGEYTKCINFAKQGILLTQASTQLKNKSYFLHKIGAAYFEMGDFQQSLIHYQQALVLREEINDSLGVAKTLGNIGNVYYYGFAEYSKALDMELRCMKICEMIGATDVLRNTLNSLGEIYANTGDYSKSLDYHFKSLHLEEKANNQIGIAQSLGNIGHVYSSLKNLGEALRYQENSLKIAKELGDKFTMSAALHSLGSIYQEKLKYDSALAYFLESKRLCEESHDKQGMLAANLSISNIYSDINKYAAAEKTGLEAINLAKELGITEYEKEGYKNLTEIYAKMNNPVLGYDAYRKFINLKDSLNGEANQKQMIKHEMNFEFDKKESLMKANEEKRAALAASESKRQKLIIYSISFGFLLVLLLSGSIYRSLRNNKKKNKIIAEQKLLVEIQKSEVEHKNKEILDSITYAKRIQEAILPTLSSISGRLPQSFVLYKAKDIVAGDFYWMETKDSITWIAAADCTGHGVPGAIVSVVCSNALNRSFKEFGLTEPGTILDKTRELVLETFAKSDKDVKDGMDISLCSVNSETREIKWAGANNPLWYINNNGLNEIKANKQPIGKTDDPRPFTTHSIQLNKGDCVYLFTDGYADQFGGPKGKKFKYKQLEEMLVVNYQRPEFEQKEILERSFENWRGSLEQVDDVCIIGMRI